MKKVISVILALALCISLVPAVFATDTGYEWARNPKTYVYEFNNSAHETNTAEADNWLHKVEHRIATAASGTPEWGFVGLQNFHNYYTTDTWLNMAAHVKEDDGTPYFGPGTNAPAGEFKTAFGLELDVDASGKYTPSITFKTGTSAPIVDIFLVEKPVDENEAEDWYSSVRYNAGVASGLNTGNFYNHVEETDSSNRIGIGINMYGSTTVNKTVVLSPVTLDANKNYFLLIVPCGIDPKATVEEYSSSAYDSAVIKLVSFELSEELTETKAEMLNYDITLNAIDVDKLTEQAYNKNTSLTSEVIRTGKKTLDNLNLVNWKYTLKKTDYQGQYIMNLGKTAPYAIEAENGKIAGVYSGALGSGGYAGTINIANYSNTSTDRPLVTVRMNIPYSGKYRFKIADGQTNADDDPFMQVYFGKAQTTYAPANIDAWLTSNAFLGWFSSSNWGTATDTTSGAMFSSSMKASDKGTNDTSTFVKNYAVDGFTVDVPTAGEYWVVLNACADSLILNSAVRSDKYQYLRFSSITLTPLPGEMGAEEAAIAAVANTMTKDIAEESEHSLSDKAVVNVLTTTVNSTEDTTIHTVTPYTTTRGAEFTVEAPKYDDYTFLYWTKGIGADRRVVSDSESYTLTAPAGGTYLTAVYKAKDDAQTSVVFFDASGNELSRTLYDEGEAIVFPSVPSLTDHTFEGWALAGQTGTVESATATGNQMIFVAQFSEELTGKSVAVKVNGVATNYAYGSLVEVSATERKNGNGSDVFLYWTKDNEIVSFDKNYSFLAAENCGLEAVYGAYKPSITDSLRRIIISESFAEFIGLDAAKEKGVLFNKNGGEVSLETATHKIAIKNGGNQLKFENDLTSVASVIGYAIMDDDTVIYGK